jgi:hypothetical protein
MITSKAANGYQFKTGQRKWPSRTEIVLPCRLPPGKRVCTHGTHVQLPVWFKRDALAAVDVISALNRHGQAYADSHFFTTSAQRAFHLFPPHITGRKKRDRKT